MVLKRMPAKYPPATNYDYSREQGIPEPTRMLQERFLLDEAIEVTESRVLGWTTSFGMV